MDRRKFFRQLAGALVATGMDWGFLPEAPRRPDMPIPKVLDICDFLVAESQRVMSELAKVARSRSAFYGVTPSAPFPSGMGSVLTKLEHS